ncbi:MAG: class I SAM-dependent DNA methyltransferase [Paracoccaceae bacterium]
MNGEGGALSGLSDDLGTVYGAADPSEARAAYDRWAESCDAENIANGFRLAGLAATMVARHVPPGDGPILEAACGTGQLGEHLRLFGYGDLHGLDLSPGMLAVAARLGAYASLAEHDLSEPIPAPDGAYRAALCFGAFGPGHAPVGTLDDLARVTRPGGHVIFNVRSDSFEEQGFGARLRSLEADGIWTKLDETADARVFLLSEPELKVRLFAFRVGA